MRPLLSRIKALFVLPSAAVVAERELNEAKLDLLRMEAGEEYHKHNASMLRVRITRLEGKVALASKE